jgi:hypothetical protein
MLIRKGTWKAKDPAYGEDMKIHVSKKFFAHFNQGQFLKTIEKSNRNVLYELNYF